MWYICHKPLYNVLLPLNFRKTGDLDDPPNKRLCQMMLRHLSYLIYHSKRCSSQCLQPALWGPYATFLLTFMSLMSQTNVPKKLWHYFQRTNDDFLACLPALQSEIYLHHINVQAEFCARDLTGELEFTIKIDSHFCILWWSFKLLL